METHEPIKGKNRGNAGKGRPKGSPNKITKSVREAILAAFDEVGGINYLKIQAEKNPTAFLGLLWKILPTQLDHSGKINGAVTQSFSFRILKPGEDFPVLEAEDHDDE